MNAPGPFCAPADGRARPSIFAFHICLTFIRAMNDGY
jgi:hypothetical protein